MMRAQFSRRGAIGLIGSAAGVGMMALPVPGFAATSVGSPVLVDERLSRRELDALAPLLDGLAPIPLAVELVRQWRDGIEADFRRDGELLCLARWDHANLLRDLAREAGARADLRRVGPGVFTVRLHLDQGRNA